MALAFDSEVVGTVFSRHSFRGSWFPFSTSTFSTQLPLVRTFSRLRDQLSATALPCGHLLTWRMMGSSTARQHARHAETLYTEA